MLSQNLDDPSRRLRISNTEGVQNKSEPPSFSGKANFFSPKIVMMLHCHPGYPDSLSLVIWQGDLSWLIILKKEQNYSGTRIWKAERQDLMTSLQVAAQNLLPVITACCFFNNIRDVRD